MPDLVPTDEMNRTNLADHAFHDLDLIAASIDGDLPDPQRAAADDLAAACATCADLRRDLVALAAATRALPRSATAPRDFRLDAEQAARLRHRGLLRRLLRPLAAPGAAARPMAAAFTTLGLAGGRLDTQTAASNAPVAAPVAGQGAAPSGGSGGSEYQAVQASHGANDQAGKADNATSIPPRDAANAGPGAASGQQPAGVTSGVVQPQPNLLVVGSAVLLAIGLGLFALRFAARRTR